MPTGITWCDETWNPISGCSPISEGCAHCYAAVMAKRLQAAGKGGYEHGFDFTAHPDKVDLPKRWRKPRHVFVVSMGDLFHEMVPDYVIRGIWSVMVEKAPYHTYFVLTKRPERMRKFVLTQFRWSHIWLGVSVENQARADERIPILLDMPAMYRFVSCGPLLGEVSLRKYVFRLDWVIAEGESGPGWRDVGIGPFRLLRDECRGVVPFHLKQFAGFRPEKNPELDGRRHTARPPFEEEP